MIALCTHTTLKGSKVKVQSNTYSALAKRVACSSQSCTIISPSGSTIFTPLSWGTATGSVRPHPLYRCIPTWGSPQWGCVKQWWPRPQQLRHTCSAMCEIDKTDTFDSLGPETCQYTHSEQYSVQPISSEQNKIELWSNHGSVAQILVHTRKRFPAFYLILSPANLWSTRHFERSHYVTIGIDLASYCTGTKALDKLLTCLWIQPFHTQTSTALHQGTSSSPPRPRLNRNPPWQQRWQQRWQQEINNAYHFKTTERKIYYTTITFAQFFIWGDLCLLLESCRECSTDGECNLGLVYSCHDNNMAMTVVLVESNFLANAALLNESPSPFSFPLNVVLSGRVAMVTLIVVLV